MLWQTWLYTNMNYLNIIFFDLSKIFAQYCTSYSPILLEVCMKVFDDTDMRKNGLTTQHCGIDGFSGVVWLETGVCCLRMKALVINIIAEHLLLVTIQGWCVRLPSISPALCAHFSSVISHRGSCHQTGRTQAPVRRPGNTSVIPQRWPV